MKAIVVNKAGGVENLVYQDIEKPTLKKGEILVSVRAIGINPADTKARKSEDFLTDHLGPARPAILGWDVSGVIAERADGTDGYEIGDKVFGLLQSGRGYAEYVAVPAQVMAHKPENLSYEQAAAMPIAAITAWNPLVNLGKIKKGDRVLIHGGAGGVGHFGIQIAKHFGATVITTATEKNREFVLSLGADQHVDYTRHKLHEVISTVDFVLDTIGGETLSHSLYIVKSGGMIITTIPGYGDQMKEKAQGKNVHLSFGGTDITNLRRDILPIADLAGRGIIKPHIFALYPFSEMAKAHTQVESGRTVGKVVVTV